MMFQDMRSHPRVQPIALNSSSLLLTPFVLLLDRQAGRSQLFEPAAGAVLRPSICFEHIGNGPIERWSIASRWPDYSRCLKPCCMGYVINRRRFDNLLFVEQWIGNKRH